jgi:hypothetical protein
LATATLLRERGLPREPADAEEALDSAALLGRSVLWRDEEEAEVCLEWLLSHLRLCWEYVDTCPLLLSIERSWVRSWKEGVRKEDPGEPNERRMSTADLRMPSAGGRGSPLRGGPVIHVRDGWEEEEAAEEKEDALALLRFFFETDIDRLAVAALVAATTRTLCEFFTISQLGNMLYSPGPRF